MDIKRLPVGEVAPVDSDCIKITKTQSGGFELITSALAQCEGDEEAISEAVISSDEYDSYEKAEEAGVAWAERRCVELVYVETD
jgi:hypothetical protein